MWPALNNNRRPGAAQQAPVSQAAHTELPHDDEERTEDDEWEEIPNPHLTAGAPRAAPPNPPPFQGTRWGFWPLGGNTGANPSSSTSPSDSSVNQRAAHVTPAPISTAIVVQRPLPQWAIPPQVWAVAKQAASLAWTTLKACHRYVLVPAASWALQQLKAHLDEQLALQRLMGRPCAVPRYSEAELKPLMEEGGLALRLRALGSPHGFSATLARVRNHDVAVKHVTLGSVAAAVGFWEEMEAGHALRAAQHPNLVAYYGCCPAMGCHVYEQLHYVCTLRQALSASLAPSSAGAQHGALLGSWEARAGACLQVAAAAACMAARGVSARNLSTSNIVLLVDGSATRVKLAPGCDFTMPGSVQPPPRPAPLAPAPTPRASSLTSSPPATAPAGATPGPRPSADAGPGVGAVAAQQGAAPAAPAPPAWPATLAQAVGGVLLEVLFGVDRPLPSRAVLMAAIANTQVAALMDPRVIPRLTDEVAWPAVAAIYPLLNWPGCAGSDVNPIAGAAAAGAGGAAAAPQRAAGMAGTASAVQSGGVELARYLEEEVLPALVSMSQRLRSAPAAVAAAPLRGPPTPLPVPASPARAAPSAPPQVPPRAVDPYGLASAPPLDAHPSVAGQGLSASTPHLSAHPSPPAEFLCPITHELMEDPVVAADGHSYERQAIAQWLAGGRTISPMTGAPLAHLTLTPNFALRSMALDWRTRYGTAARS